ncbi:MAG TPA: hypothetical protein VFF69_14780 [Phycisphaerales bacterium]|nr:hypothetical protein [Phycisphaerales bacterium]
MSAGVLVGVGCQSYPLHGMLSDPALHSRLAENFSAGMSYDEINSRLTELRVSEDYRHTYGDAPPREMLARLFPPGGFWVDRKSQHVRWIDLTFAFDENDALEGLWTFRGGARYIDGFPSFITPSPVLGRPRYYPAAPPPPVTPPREEEVALP